VGDVPDRPTVSDVVPPRSVVVVGAGLAGAGLVAALRAGGFDGRLTVLGAEGLPPYDRPPLSKELLSRTEPLWLADDLGLDLAGADEVRLAEPAVDLVPAGNAWTVRTAHDEVSADVVVLATGASAVVPTGWERAATLHTAADAAVLRALLVPGSRLVVVGAGWIGAEVAGVAAAAGVQVTVVEAAGSPLSTALGPEVGALTESWYAAAGVRLLTGALVVRVGADAVELADGEVLHADVVLAAVGARPASDWSDALPVAADGSVLVDAGYRALGGPPGLVAVGDVARRRSPRHGWVPGGHWDGALRGPAIAVRALLEGSEGLDDPAPYVFSTQLGHELTLYGQPSRDDDVVLRGDPTAGFGALWFHPGTDVLTAALAVDSPRDVSAARRLFDGVALPRLDRAVAADAGRSLRDARR